jgi:hypothetical protein
MLQNVRRCRSDSLRSDDKEISTEPDSDEYRQGKYIPNRF